VVTLTYQAATDDQTLHVTFTKTTPKPAFASFEAVTLSGGSGGGLDLPPTMTTIANQAVVEGEEMSVDVTGTDPEGTAVTISQTVLSGSPTVAITNHGNGMATISWTPGPSDLGNHTIGISAMDETGATSSQTFDVFVSAIGGGSGALAGQLDTTNDTVQLADLGSIDWVNYGLTLQRKAAVTPSIGEATSLSGDAHAPFAGTDATYAWTGGTPVSSGSASDGYKQFVVNEGFQLTVPAGTAARQLLLYVGSKGTMGRVTATLGDGSAAPITVDVASGSKASHVVAIDFQAGSAGQTLTVRYEKTATGGWISLEGAALR
jgi:hypothetical protein